MRAGMRHIIFENHGTQIHEAMFIKLPAGMSVGDFQGQMNEGILFREGVLIAGRSNGLYCPRVR